MEPLDRDVEEFELSSLDESSRWHLDLMLAESGVAYQWTGRKLSVSPQGRESVVRFLQDNPPNPSVVDEIVRAMAHGDAPLARAEDDSHIPVGRVRRFIAYVIDGALTNSIVLLVVSVWWMLATHSTGHGRSHLPRGAEIGAFATSAAIMFAYSVVSVAVFGRTLGKAATRLRVVTTSGHRAGWKEAILRAALPTLAAWIWVVFPDGPSWSSPLAVAVTLSARLVIYSPVLYDELGQGHHDKLAHTVVVSD